MALAVSVLAAASALQGAYADQGLAIGGIVVLTGSGEPVRRGHVDLHRVDSEEPRTTVRAELGAAGRFRAAGFEPGTWSGTVTASGMGSRYGISATGPESLTHSIFLFTVKLQPGEPIAEAPVRIAWGDGRGFLQRAITDDQGRFTAVSRDFRPCRGKASVVVREHTAPWVPFDAEGRRTLDLQSGAPISIRRRGSAAPTWDGEEVRVVARGPKETWPLQPHGDGVRGGVLPGSYDIVEVFPGHPERVLARGVEAGSFLLDLEVK